MNDDIDKIIKDEINKIMKLIYKNNFVKVYDNIFYDDVLEDDVFRYVVFQHKKPNEINIWDINEIFNIYHNNKKYNDVLLRYYTIGDIAIIKIGYYSDEKIINLIRLKNN